MESFSHRLVCLQLALTKGIYHLSSPCSTFTNKHRFHHFYFRAACHSSWCSLEMLFNWWTILVKHYGFQLLPASSDFSGCDTQSKIISIQLSFQLLTSFYSQTWLATANKSQHPRSYCFLDHLPNTCPCSIILRATELRNQRCHHFKRDSILLLVCKVAEQTKAVRNRLEKCREVLPNLISISIYRSRALNYLVLNNQSFYND